MFSYGQTGSGKTYTLEGTEKNPGVAPLILQNLAEQCKIISVQMVKFCCVEDYQQNIRDLLDDDKDKKIKIQYITGRATKIIGVNEETVNVDQLSEEEISRRFKEIYSRASKKYILHKLF